LGVNAQHAQCLDQVLVGFARSDDSQLASAAIEGDFVDIVGAHKFVYQRQAVASDQDFIQLLGADHRGGRQVFVDTRLEEDVMGGELLLFLPQ
jgi:hypothetical protein